VPTPNLSFFRAEPAALAQGMPHARDFGHKNMHMHISQKQHDAPQYFTRSDSNRRVLFEFFPKKKNFPR
jgi:hypothetical protein